MNPVKIFTLALFLSLCLALGAGATSVMPVDVSQAVDSSDLIFTGHAIAREVAVTQDGRTPFTFITFAVEEVLKGQVDGSEVTLRFFGGEHGGEVIEAVGMPRFEELGQYLLFVEGNGDSFCPIVGWWQGKLDLVPHPQTGKAMLIDHRGTPITGLNESSWTKAQTLRVGDDGTFESTGDDGTTVLWQDGVEIVDDSPSLEAAKAAVVPAEDVLSQLRSLVELRRAAKSFRPGKTVSSALAMDLPESVTFEATAPH